MTWRGELRTQGSDFGNPISAPRAPPGTTHSLWHRIRRDQTHPGFTALNPGRVRSTGQAGPRGHKAPTAVAVVLPACEGSSCGPGSMCRVLGPQRRIYSHVLRRPSGQIWGGCRALCPCSSGGTGSSMQKQAWAEWDVTCALRIEVRRTSGSPLPLPQRKTFLPFLTGNPAPLSS